VVEVEVGEDEQVDAVDAERAEALLDQLGIGPGIDQRGLGRAAHENGVSLPDVALGVLPVLGAREPGSNRRAGARTERPDDDDRDDGCRGSPPDRVVGTVAECHDDENR